MSSSAQNEPCDTHECSILGVIATKGDASQHLGLSANAVIELEGREERSAPGNQDDKGKETQAQPTSHGRVQKHITASG